MTKHELYLVARSLRVMLENNHIEEALDILDGVIKQVEEKPRVQSSGKSKSKPKEE
ncbi:MAG: hypothetical protein FWB91_02310 [Defluviitaleaceae bacterium]|nr:hypothetical protein [Defluviitaleaceae bacterium]